MFSPWDDILVLPWNPCCMEIGNWYKQNPPKQLSSPCWHEFRKHYSDVIMGAIASQITSLAIVYSTVYSGADQIEHQGVSVTGLCVGNSSVTDEFPAQMASNAEYVFDDVIMSEIYMNTKQYNKYLPIHSCCKCISIFMYCRLNYWHVCQVQILDETIVKGIKTLVIENLHGCWS